MKAHKRWPWKNVEVEPDPVCLRCAQGKSKHIEVNGFDGTGPFTVPVYICPNLTFLSRSELRSGKAKP